MSIQLFIVVVIIISICTIIFTKTVSNDAKNDFKIRDILSNNDESESVKSIFEPVKSVNEEKSFEDFENQKNIYEEISEEQNKKEKQDYNTTIHSAQKQEEPEIDQEEDVYYEKINDEACSEEYNEKYKEDDEYEQMLYKKPVVRGSLFDYVKTFWRGITFTIGLLVCLYSVIGIAYQVQTSNDAIIYSLWLLIGVILIK